jgi:hypothetical protein
MPAPGPRLTPPLKRAQQTLQSVLRLPGRSKGALFQVETLPLQASLPRRSCPTKLTLKNAELRRNTTSDIAKEKILELPLPPNLAKLLGSKSTLRFDYLQFLRRQIAPLDFRFTFAATKDTGHFLTTPSPELRHVSLSWRHDV